jgi:CopA family copper-resistance protein
MRPHIFLILLVIGYVYPCFAQRPVKEYYLILKESKVSKAGYMAKAITINDSIPGPTLYFTEGDSAVIHIKNELGTASSIHFHGMLIPNLMDGVPYLSTPPIAAGKIFTARFPIRQTGTYWYHSHSMFQEQSGLYGAIVIYPKHPVQRQYDKEMVLLLSDWTIENPSHIMNNLKRGSEWYSVKKHTAQSLLQVISHHGLGERIQMAWQRMPPMDISDVYYNAFLTNGDSVIRVPNVYPGERIRLRVIDGSSSTFFHLQYSGGKMQIIAADGQDVKPVSVDRLLMGIAETYDVIITIPSNGEYEFRATAQDGSGHTSVYFGKGILHPAPALPKPDLFHMEGIMMDGMTDMKMHGMNMHMSHQRMQQETPYIKKAYIDREDMDITGENKMMMKGMNMQMMNMQSGNADTNMHDMKMDNTGMHDMSMDNMNMSPDSSKKDSVIFNYNMLHALHPTSYDTTGHMVRHLTFNLTGSMWRYIWSINGKTLSEDDSIQVKEGEILFITMNNQTMMYHPMHLHGHFFRLINNNGTYSPLKHTVIVPPMRSVTIEFLANEPGDWFFHCHILYHMMSGMARSFQYQGYHRPTIMDKYPMKKLFDEDNHWYFWGNVLVASNHNEGYLSYSNRISWLKLAGDYGWSGQRNEVTGTYEYFATRYLRPYAGFVTSNKEEYTQYYKDHNREIPSQDIREIVGVRYLLPFFLNADLRIDNHAHVRFGLSGETWLLPGVWLTYSWNTDKEYEVNIEGMIDQYFSVSAGYSSDYRWGAGLMVRF